jgi:ABC-type transporter Mla subunit MlaD
LGVRGAVNPRGTIYNPQPMSSYRRNVIVGVVVLGGLIALAWMMLRFAGRAANFFLAGGTPVTVRTDRADGVADGSAVLFKGVNVGRVVKVYRKVDDDYVYIDLLVDADPPLPGDIVADIKANSLLGASASIDLRPPSADELRRAGRGPGTAQSQDGGRARAGTGAAGTAATTAARSASPGEPSAGAPGAASPRTSPTTDPMTMPQVGMVAVQSPPPVLRAGQTIPAQFSGMNFAEVTGLFERVREQQLVEHVNQTVEEVRRQVQKTGHMLDELNALVSDPQMQADVRKTVANIREATEAARRVSGDLEKFTADLKDISVETRATVTEVRTTVVEGRAHMDDLAERIAARVDQLADVLQQVQSVAAKVNSGEGTAGKLINDPKLYESMVDTAEELNLTIRDLKVLVEQWQEEGVSLRLGGK